MTDYTFKKGVDMNGNSILRFISKDGSFSVQTNGNLPKAHGLSLYGKKVEESKELLLDELKEFVAQYGTARQKRLLKNL